MSIGRLFSMPRLDKGALPIASLNLSLKALQFWPKISGMYLLRFLIKRNHSSDFTFAVCLFTRNQKLLNGIKRKPDLIKGRRTERAFFTDRDLFPTYDVYS
jgi:hypothetical protein